MRLLGFLSCALRHSRPEEAELQRRAAATLAAKIETGRSAVKLRWNACFAAGLLLRTPGVPVATAPWAALLFRALVQALQNCDNFKVRTKAVTLPRRAHARRVCCLSMALRTTVTVLANGLAPRMWRCTTTNRCWNASFGTLIHLVRLSSGEDLRLEASWLEQHTTFFVRWMQHMVRAALLCCFGSRRSSSGVQRLLQRHSDSLRHPPSPLLR